MPLPNNLKRAAAALPLRGFWSVSGLTLASRALGLCRDVVIAAVFGAGGITDAFFAAFRLPNMLRRFSAEGALTQAFVPLYAQRLQGSPAAAAALAGEILLYLGGVLLLATALTWLFAPAIMGALAPGLARPALAAQILQIVFPYVVLVSVMALLAGMLNARGHFAAAAAAPLLLNVAMIISALWWVPLFSQPILALAWGVVAGGALQLLWIAVFARRAGAALTAPRRRAPSPDACRALRLFWRSALGAGAAQFNLLINLFIASFLAAGSVSWLYFADRLMELPAGLLGAALATVALPALAAAPPARYVEIIDKALRLTVYLALPAAAGLAALALPIVCALFMHGAFNATDAQMTRQAALAYALGVPGLVAVRPLAAAFFARQDAAAPVRCALLALATTQAGNALFVWWLQWGHVGLALSVGLGATANALALYALLRRRGWYAPLAGWGRLWLRVAAGLAALLATLAAITPNAAFWLTADAAQKALWMALCVCAGAAAYLLTCKALDAPP